MCFMFCEDDPILDENYWKHLDEVCGVGLPVFDEPVIKCNPLGLTPEIVKMWGWTNPKYKSGVPGGV